MGRNMNSLMWTALEILINFYQGFIITFFTYEFLQPKNKKPYWKSIGVLWGIIIAIVITIVNYITIFEGLGAFVYIAILFICIFFSLEGTIVQKMFAVLIPYEILALVSILFANLFAVFFDEQLESILSDPSLIRFALLISAQIVIAFLFNLTLKYLKKDKCKFNKSEWKLIIVVLIITIIITTFLNTISFNEKVGKIKVLIALSSLGLGLINVVVYYIIVSLSAKNAIISENVVIKMKKEFQQEYMDKIVKENEEMRRLRHDYRGHFTIIQMLISGSQLDQAMKYIEENITVMDRVQTVVMTKNDVVNAILSSKFSQAKKNGIKVSFFSIPSFSGIEDIDLCNLLGNLLDNAIISCEECEQISKIIQINLSDETSKYTFNVKNGIPVSVMKNNPGLVTTKNDKEVHGYGIKIVRDIANKYNGKCDFYEEDNLFCCNVILMKNE